MASTLPLKLAVVGAGPSGFYLASRILSLLPFSSHPSVEVHVYDRLWAPHGLVRYGVAPDHPEVKNCTHKFDLTARDPRFRFFGNVNLSSTNPYPHNLSLPLSSLFPHYTHLAFSMGASLPHPMPALHPYSIPALSLVHWYTDHPSHLAKIPPLSSIKHLTLIGHGNVSLDIARILLTPVSSLSHLDIPSPVLKELSTSSIKHINIVSRRGPAEAAFTAKELRELMTLPSTSLLPIPPELLSGETSPPPSRQQRRILDLFRKGSTAKYGTTPTTWSLEFFRTPVSASPGKITYAITALDANRKAQLTGRTETQETDLIVSSVGYESEDLYHDWFNPSLRRVRNEKGRVYSNSTGEVVKNVYTSGWASNGAKGVLGSTMYDAYDVADVLLSDHFSPSATPSSTPSVLNPDPAPGPPPVIASANESGRKVLSYEDWKKVDEEEVRRGQVLRKERERMEWDDVVRFLSR